MPPFRKVTDTFFVSPQISPQDVEAAAAAGFRLIVNNRPDGEAPDQPSGPLIEAAARGAGLDYLHAPVVGRPSAEQVKAVRDAVAAARGPVLAYCRSGTRSINTWALGEANGDNRDDLVRAGAAAGYDLEGVLPD